MPTGGVSHTGALRSARGGGRRGEPGKLPGERSDRALRRRGDADAPGVDPYKVEREATTASRARRPDPTIRGDARPPDRARQPLGSDADRPAQADGRGQLRPARGRGRPGRRRGGAHDDHRAGVRPRRPRRPGRPPVRRRLLGARGRSGRPDDPRDTPATGTTTTTTTTTARSAPPAARCTPPMRPSVTPRTWRRFRPARPSSGPGSSRSWAPTSRRPRAQRAAVGPAQPLVRRQRVHRGQRHLLPRPAARHDHERGRPPRHPRADAHHPAGRGGHRRPLSRAAAPNRTSSGTPPSST